MRENAGIGLLVRVLGLIGILAVASVLWSVLQGVWRDTQDMKAEASSPATATTSQDASDGLGSLAMVGIVVGSAVLIALIAGVCVRWRRGRALRVAQHAVMTGRWKAATARHDGVLSAYFAVETDPISALRLPALFATASDPASPAARFLEGFDRALSLRADHQPPAGGLDEYVAAVDALVRAWEAALRDARRIGLSQLSPADGRKTTRAIRLLDKAQRSDNEFEQRACLHQASVLIDELLATGAVTLPPQAIAALGAATHLELVAAGR